MTSQEFLKGWILLIAQPWGRRYEGDTEVAHAQREFYFQAVRAVTGQTWFTACCALAAKNEWPSISVVNALVAPSGHLGAEEAWALVAPKVRSDAPTVFVTEPMREAYGAALALEDDLIAARMAFREVYTNAVGRAGGGLPVWSMIPGTDPRMKELAITEAVKRGIAQVEWARTQLPVEAHASLLAFAAEPKRLA